MATLLIPIIVLANRSSTDVSATDVDAPVQTPQEYASEMIQSLKDLGIELKLTDKIRLQALKHGVDQSIALNIACVESQFKTNAQNPTSTASGLYQYLNGTWKRYGLKLWGTLEGRSKTNEDDNIELTMYVLSTYGTSDWSVSKWKGFGGGWMNTPYEKGMCL